MRGEGERRTGVYEEGKGSAKKIRAKCNTAREVRAWWEREKGVRAQCRIV